MNNFDAFLLVFTLLIGGGVYILLFIAGIPWQMIMGISLTAFGIASAIMYALHR